MPSLIPVSLRSARLHLRCVADDDWVGLHEYYGDAECTRYTTLQPLAPEETRRMVGAVRRHWERRGYGPYVLEETATGQVLGIAGPWYPKEWPEAEIKWALARRHWGRGFAAEAARAVQAMAAVHLPGLRLISLIHADNAPSIALALAVGARFERAMDFRGGTYHVYRHPAPRPPPP
ncbi:MAG: GNAT family N-acetyltransferase [Rhodocyclaceae bacterium]|nr:GNAT family N-acetyltransferase [Rhodocyclaceae bacterium]